jgi:ABC-type transport system involved in multi-copper enzyme maturation permease subunit
VIWVTWRRYRLAFAVAVALLIVLALWMGYVAHGFDAGPRAQGGELCRFNLSGCGFSNGPFSLENQGQIIDVLLLAAPCLFGVVFGTSLVAGELERHTNRLAWTQGVSRTRWLVTQWVVVAIGLVVLTVVFVPFVQWWSSHIIVRGTVYAPVGLGRLQPDIYPVTGIVPVAYSLFALSLGMALGAVLRRVSWAIVGTVVVYALAAFFIVSSVRPNLDSQVLIRSDGGAEVNLTHALNQGAWQLDFGAKLLPGHELPTGASSATELARTCFYQQHVAQCWSSHGLEAGTYVQPLTHYWPIQFTEFVIYLVAAVLLFGLALWAVRRWRV